MEIIILTTFHQPGLDTYGQRFLNSFAQRVDKRIKLLVYAENCNPNWYFNLAVSIPIQFIAIRYGS